MTSVAWQHVPRVIPYSRWLNTIFGHSACQSTHCAHWTEQKKQQQNTPKTSVFDKATHILLATLRLKMIFLQPHLGQLFIQKAERLLGMLWISCHMALSNSTKAILCRQYIAQFKFLPRDWKKLHFSTQNNSASSFLKDLHSLLYFSGCKIKVHEKLIFWEIAMPI